MHVSTHNTRVPNLSQFAWDFPSFSTGSPSFSVPGKLGRLVTLLKHHTTTLPPFQMEDWVLKAKDYIWCCPLVAEYSIASLPSSDLHHVQFFFLTKTATTAGKKQSKDIVLTIYF